MCAGLRPAPYSSELGLSLGERKAVEQALADKGIRQLPYGFDSAVAVVSDVDGSTRARYAGYVGMLVDELGLDFGDSSWMLWERSGPRERGLGFFSPYLTQGRSSRPRPLHACAPVSRA